MIPDSPDRTSHPDCNADDRVPVRTPGLTMRGRGEAAVPVDRLGGTFILRAPVGFAMDGDLGEGPLRAVEVVCRVVNAV